LAHIVLVAVVNSFAYQQINDDCVLASALSSKRYACSKVPGRTKMLSMSLLSIYKSESMV